MMVDECAVGAFVFPAFLRKYDVDEFHLDQAYMVMGN